MTLFLPLAGAQATQGPAHTPPDSSATNGGFAFDPGAKRSLQQLWHESIVANQERVACMGGYTAHDSVVITRIEPIASTRADSANISAKASLQECAPPRWFGTVHTHIAKFNGQPYIIFSAPDRLVMSLWNERWHEDGVFCILFSDTEANCESGYRLSGHALYGYARGNNLAF